MASPRRSATVAPDLDLTKGIHARVSEEAWGRLCQAANKKGLKPATWIRVTLYKELGLIGDQS
jgi:hypothetical protein